MKKEDHIRLINTGMGGYLNPPNHPEHNWSVQTDLHKKRENRGSMRLSYTLTEEWLSIEQKQMIKDKLAEWDKLPLTHKLVKEWISKCKKHFAGYPSLLKKHIQEYYPDYK